MPVPGAIKIKQLDLELNGGCNYKCQMCPQADGRERDFLKKLPAGILEKILDDAMQYGVESVSLHGSGEPTMNVDMPDAVAAIKARGLTCISFSNGYRLNDKMSRRLIDAGIDILRISAIGADAASYHRWMSKDVFEEVRDNVTRFVQMAEGTETDIHLYHLVTDAEKRDEEITAYRRNWVDTTGAFAEIWMMHNWSGGYASPYDRATMTREPAKRSCGRPFSELLQVRAGGLGGHHGAVVACCMVLGKDGEAVLGHLDDQSIAEVIGGEPYKELHTAHREGRFDKISYCSGCDQLYDFPDALVWSNIPGRAYGQSKIVGDLDHRAYA